MGLISRVSSRTYRILQKDNIMTTEKPSLDLADQPQTKKQKLDEANVHNNGIDEAAIQEAISKIESVEEKINQLEDEQSIEICKLEQKYVERKIHFLKKE